MKKLSFLFCSIALGVFCCAQNILDNIHPLFRGELDGDKIRSQFNSTYSRNFYGTNLEMPIRMVVFISNHLAITGQMAYDKIPEIKMFQSDTSSRNEVLLGTYSARSAIPVFDSTGIIVTAYNIDHTNASDFEFRVVENKTKIVIPWRAITLFCETYYASKKPDGSEQNECGYLGQFRTSFGNNLTIEIRKKNTGLLQSTLSAIWINHKPSVIGVFTSGDMPDFLNIFKKQWQHDQLPGLAPAERTEKDSLLKLKKDFNTNENSLIFYLDDKVSSKEIIEYQLVCGKNKSSWKTNDFDLNLIWLKNLAPGQYKLRMRYSIQRHNVSTYEFNIEPDWYQTMTFKIIAAILILGLVGFVIMLFIARRQQQKLQNEQLQKRQLQTELMSIHSQFNPHFVFNALNSIQGLITKNDLDGANKYLSEFSALLRDSLRESNNEMFSLLMEVKMLESYLKLEQLRFGFTYSIDIDESIDKNAVEVPILLLQPLIENAIKHGIASLYDKGKLTINFKRSTDSMLIIISDNGNGFNTKEAISGFGLKLTRDRVALLNRIMKSQVIELSINSSYSGTIVELLFKNWLK